jgi:general secretion pathway protein G
MKKDKKGFTLIELLVVIAIIAILSTVVMAGLNSARQKGRDAKRLSDIKQVQAALELFYDTNGGYPAVTPAALLNTTLAAYTGFTVYMNPLPVNPTPVHTAAATYLYGGTATAYTITFALEGSTGSLTVPGVHYATPSGIQ